MTDPRGAKLESGRMALDLDDVRAHVSEYKEYLERVKLMLPMIIETLSDEVAKLRAENARLRADKEPS